MLPPPRPANKEILLHQQKRDIEVALLKLREELQEKGYALNIEIENFSPVFFNNRLTEEKIAEKVSKAEAILREKLEKGELNIQRYYYY